MCVCVCVYVPYIFFAKFPAIFSIWSTSTSYFLQMFCCFHIMSQEVVRNNMIPSKMVPVCLSQRFPDLMFHYALFVSNIMRTGMVFMSKRHLNENIRPPIGLQWTRKSSYFQQPSLKRFERCRFTNTNLMPIIFMEI